MNVENIKKVRDVIAGLPEERFDMRLWAAEIATIPNHAHDVEPAQMLHDCGTCGCIGGWTEALFNSEVPPGDECPAEVWLDLPQLHAVRLFFPIPERDVTPAQAVAVLDHLLATDKVDWSVADQVPA